MRDDISPPAHALDGTSVTELARRAGLDQSTVYRVAAGSTSPTLDTLRGLAIALGLDLSVSTVAGPSGLWGPDVRSAMRMFTETHREVAVVQNAHVTMARVDDVTLVNAHRRGPLRDVAPAQCVLGPIGLGGEIERAALVVVETW